MGERPSDGGLSGRGSRHALLDSGVEALIVASLVRDGVDAEGERRAVAAFRAARDARALGARTRRRDDWRAGERRHPGRSLKTTLSVLLAGLTLGGVAVAAIGVAGSQREGTKDAPERRPAPSSTPHDPAGQPPGADRRHSRGPGTGPGSAPAHPGRPAPAQDTEAHCRAYEDVRQRGKAMEATAWRRLVAAAGGESKVTAYCSERLGEPRNEGGGSANGNAPEVDATPPADNGGGNESGNQSDKSADSGAGKSRSEDQRSRANNRHR
ncbi:hypothetical protein ADK65_33025 [Streptomyces sp. NRRL B-1140]|uniref:hypothetical protein n=1 Tax=Streptomyces sp. NRRL B-1140 TaxID=1415549 RepID=UPI0006AEB4C7|nr:hypothetical protein [Streptomyces sp. NRRL B-1140]KOV93532.1 hypothetical protein ADK65_33025 [Streptomyces sp. NRRL B-1140]